MYITKEIDFGLVFFSIAIKGQRHIDFLNQINQAAVRYLRNKMD